MKSTYTPPQDTYSEFLKFMFPTKEFMLTQAKAICIQYGVDPVFLSEANDETLSLLTSLQAQMYFAKDSISLKEVINLPVEKVRILLTTEASNLYSLGIKASQFLDSPIEDIKLLISDAAYDSYKSKLTDIDALAKQSYNDKLLTLLKIYYTNSSNTGLEIDALLKIEGIEKAKLLLSNFAYTSFKLKLISLEQLIKCNTVEDIEFVLCTLTPSNLEPSSVTKEEVAVIESSTQGSKDTQKQVTYMNHIIHNNPLLNVPKLLDMFQVKYGLQKLDQLIDLSSNLANSGEGFKSLLADICNDADALSQLELLMGLDSNSSDSV